jgi:hypothetical protein
LPNPVQLIFELVNPVLVRLKNFFQFMTIAFVLSLLVVTPTFVMVRFIVLMPVLLFTMPTLLQFSRCVMGDLF